MGKEEKPIKYEKCEIDWFLRKNENQRIEKLTQQIGLMLSILEIGEGLYEQRCRII